MGYFNRTALIFILIFLGGSGFGQIQDAPADVTAAMLIKVIAFETHIANKGEISIYILDAPAVADELQSGVEKPIGKSILKSIQSGNKLPEHPPTLLYIGDPDHLETAIQYTQKNKILSVTGKPDLVKKGVALGFGVGSDGKPKILLNLSSSVKESLDWNPAILKIAKTIR